ncbi:Uncharacterized protein PECH_005977 [Penicillium ucsense]|uniref:Uncharacterized protein n=1 Tax=Penicillium ucsense TaxID=2839758 RepID=A0A8J8W1V4_9EURO|nr:Uncharacterized protein PECM_006468 [Penicillium ucsense]KAF7735943.1 Uncharacterized protein PECH_005977 [Penicillium ucsense]
MENREDKIYNERRASKAQRILGTNLPLPAPQRECDKPQKTRRHSVRTPDNSSRQQKQSSAFAAFPSSRDAIAPPPNLRVRASSPLLGYNYHAQESAPSKTRTSKKVHQSGSSSTLFSYFSSKEQNKSSSVASPTSIKPSSLQPHIRHELGFDPKVTYKQQPRSKAGKDQGIEKEAKRKLRPSRLDLSLLFPKPRNHAPPLLSPHRMTQSPSPASSVASDRPSARLERGSGFPSPKTPGESVPPRSLGIYRLGSKSNNDLSDLHSIPESKDSEWYDQSLERIVGTSEIDIALDRYAGRRSLFSRSSVYTGSRDHLRLDSPRTTEGEFVLRREQAPPTSRPGELFLVAAPQPKSTPRHRASTTESSKSRGGKSSVSRQSSKSTLRNKDLQNSSVLCLSSSEDEDEECADERPRLEPTRDTKVTHRDRAAPYHDPEQEATNARTLPALASKRPDRAPSNSSHGSYSESRQQSTQKYASVESTGQLSVTARRIPNSARSSDIPIIAEPDILSQFPQQPSRTPQELRELNRRSRVIAVTRQEQDLLEAMRQRKGKITPSILNLNSGTAESDGNSLASGPSQGSFCDVDTSFLRLSATLSSVQSRTDQGVVHTDSDGGASQSLGSDNEQTNDTRFAWPGRSAGYSESLPSPPASAASPLTPTLPSHRFSPLPSAKPPPRRPPPAIPEDLKLHSRRRTDSSEAIMLNDDGELQRKQDLPIWAFDRAWDQGRVNIGSAH